MFSLIRASHQMGASYSAISLAVLRGVLSSPLHPVYGAETHLERLFS